MMQAEIDSVARQTIKEMGLGPGRPRTNYDVRPVSIQLECKEMMKEHLGEFLHDEILKILTLR